MDTLEFFRRILPTQGYKVLAEFANNRRYPLHSFHETYEEAATTALELDASGKNIYHACAGYITSKNRKAENAGWMRSFWVDADVEPGNPLKYETLRDALTDIARVCKELALPMPLIVQSGGGAHAYWTLNDDITSELWNRVASVFKKRLEDLGFRQDRTRTADSASVLRPVGTHWRKDGCREVVALSAGTPVSIDDFVSALGCGLDDGANSMVPAPDVFGGAGFDDLGTVEYRPSSADTIALHCPTLAHISVRRGDCEEPLWRGMLGLVKFTTEGTLRGHEWSVGHPEYSEADTQEKLDRWVHGPTTCAYFRGTNGNQCGGCSQTCTSPISLGYSEDGVAVVPAEPVTPDAPPTFEAIPHWPKRSYNWDGHIMSRAVKEGAAEDAVIRWVPFCNTLFFPVMRVRNEEDVWSLRIRHLTKDKRWHEFDLPTELIGSNHGLGGALASQEVIVTGKNGVNHTKDFLSTYLLDLQENSVEQHTYAKMGWVDDHSGFVIGSQRISSAGDSIILPGDQIRNAGWDRDFGCSGTVEEWTALIDQVYNRIGGEPYQFILAAAFAAPLVDITEVDNWHGIPVALTGTTGLGKTTTCRVACSIYGQGDLFLRTASKEGSTLNSMVSRIGVIRNLPMIFDEITNREQEEVISFLYMLSNGRPKDRNRADGKLIDLGLSWNTISLITSNRNVTELISTCEERNVAEATQIRVFEIALTDDYNTAIWGDTNAVDLIEHKLKEQYGHVGRLWLRYIIDNTQKLRDEIRVMRMKYNPNDKEETRERYYRDLIAVVLVALKHMTKLGLVKFDLLEIAKWARANTLSLRTRRGETNAEPEDFIAAFLSTLQGRTIVTKHYRDGRQHIETPMQDLRYPAVARMATVDQKFFVLRKALADWCIERKLSPNTLVNEMGRRGYIIYNNESGTPSPTRRERITRGTGLPGSPAYVVEIDYNMITSGAPTLAVVPTETAEAQ